MKNEMSCVILSCNELNNIKRNIEICKKIHISQPNSGNHARDKIRRGHLLRGRRGQKSVQSHD